MGILAGEETLSFFTPFSTEINNKRKEEKIIFHSSIFFLYGRPRLEGFSLSMEANRKSQKDKDKNQHKLLKIQQIFPKLYRCLLYVVFHNLEPQNAGLVDVKKDLNSKRSKGIFVHENLKNKHSY